MFDSIATARRAWGHAVGGVRPYGRAPWVRRLGLLATACASVVGCAMADAPLSREQFASRIATLLEGRDAVEMPASALTAFPWQRLCFERGDALLLTFSADGKTRVLALPYTQFFVDEGHVPGSLEDACVAPGDRILVKKKYPGHAGPVEFQKRGP
jgi:hypothetical protein